MKANMSVSYKERDTVLYLIVLQCIPNCWINGAQCVKRKNRVNVFSLVLKRERKYMLNF